MFVPSSYSDHLSDDYAGAAPSASAMRRRLQALGRRRVKTKRGSPAYQRLTREMRALEGRLEKLAPSKKPPLPRARPTPAKPKASSTSSSRAAEPADESTADEEEDHDLAVSADVAVDVDAPPLFKRPIFWVGLGVVGVAYWKRDTIIRMVKGA